MRVMIIEDENDLAEAIAINLTDSRNAVDIADHWTIGLFKSLEIVMAKSSRIRACLEQMVVQVCRALREEKPDIFILLLSAGAVADDVILGQDSGADDRLAKHIQIGELNARVRTLSQGGPERKRACLTGWGYST